MIGAQGQLGISEFVAANTAGLVDEDGDHSDWIELVNLGEELVELDGWHLTDDVEDPEKWSLPEAAMAPGERRIVFASDKNRRETDGEWHANFRLGREGEFLALRHPNGEWVGAFAPAYPEQVDDVSYGEGRYWPSPSPGLPNELAANDPPFLVGQSHEPAIPQEGEDVIISARLQEGGGGIAAATLITRIMYRPESITPLLDDGQGPDGEAGDGVYSAIVPARTLFGSRYAAGQMIRWAIVVTDNEGAETRFPPLSESRLSAAYFGTVVSDPDAESALPVLHWFVEDERGATSTTGSRASAFFDGQFYDNFFVRRRGQFGAIDWAKPKIKFDFNSGDHFRHRPDRRRVEEFNLQSHYVDSSYMRENVAFEFFNEAGTPAPFTQHWHVRRNGAYYGLFSFVEQVDEDFLIRHDLDPEGAMYKANGFPSTLAVGVTSALYQKETRKHEPYDDLVAFVDGINGIGVDRRVYVMDHVDLPAVINETACHAILHNADRLTKNYYIYEDPETDLWRRMPWDLDGAFGSGGSLDTENFASPLYGDSEHTQAPNQAIYQNFLLDAILDDPVMREMYLRRLRTLMDRYLSPESDYFPSRLRHYLQLIQDEATRDAQKWGRPNVQAGVDSIIRSALPNRWRQLTESYGPPGQGLVPEMQSAGVAPSIGSLDFRPENPLAEYIEVINPHTEAIDLSGWRLEGAIEFEFPAGTVVPRRGTILQPDRGRLFVVRDHGAFRERQTSPRGGEGLLVVGAYQGQLSARGETIQLYNADGELSAEKQYDGDPSPQQQWLRVTELNYHPRPATFEEREAGFTTEAFEFIELKNLAHETLLMEGVTFDEGVRFTFSGELTMEAGAYAVLVKNAEAFRFRFGDGIPIAGVYDGFLQNGGETIRLHDRFGENVLSFRYEDSWASATDGEGYTLVPTLESASTDAWDESTAWRASRDRDGSPGAPDAGSAFTYERWKEGRFSLEEAADPMISGPAADPDGDGISNLLAYAFALGGPGGHLPVVSMIEGRAVVRFTRWTEVSDLNAVIETSMDLVEWAPVADDAVEVYEMNGDLKLVETRIAADLSGRLFVRIAVALDESD